MIKRNLILFTLSVSLAGHCFSWAAGNIANIYTEDRSRPVEPENGLPEAWGKLAGQNKPAAFTGVARPGEYYVFQVGIEALQDTGPLAVQFSDLQDKATGKVIPAKALDCLSLGGVGTDGKLFHKSIKVPAGKVQVLWMAVDIPANVRGDFSGIVTVNVGNGVKVPVALSLAVSGEPVIEHGDNDPKNLSRLRWLNSTAGSGDTLTGPFTAIETKGKNTLGVLGRDLQLTPTGLPGQVISYFTRSNTQIGREGKPLLKSPMSFVAETEKGAVTWKPGSMEVKRTDTMASWTVSLDGTEGLRAVVNGKMDYTGTGEIDIEVTADKDVSLRDIRLDTSFALQDPYFMGLHKQGGKLAKYGKIDWRWDISKRQDCFWLGDVDVGMMLRFKDENFIRPLVNIYYSFRKLVEPKSWGNDTKGGIKIDAVNGTTQARAYSGQRQLRAGEKLHFVFEFYLTPFRTLDTESQWKYRYVQPHPNKSPQPYDKVLADADAVKGPNLINLHQAAYYNPYINYPFNEDSFPDFCDYVKRAHAKNVGVRSYYTTREVTNNMREFVPLHTFNGEIIQPGPGPAARTLIRGNGPDPKLTATLGNNFIPAWVDKVGGKYAEWDLSVITTPDSRWNNFYLEGLRWMVEKSDFDGPYIDDTALDAHSMQRARRILDTRPGRQIDFHTWNHFNEWAGIANNLTIYMELLPYIDRLWIGEAFDCNNASLDFWLVEMSGLPFGFMSEMLQSPNPLRGMVFGETGRLGWAGDPRGMWKIWDEYGIQGTQFHAYFDPATPVKSGRQDVPVSVYQKPGRAFVAVGGWVQQQTPVTLQIDWKALGMDAGKARLYAPEIPGVQKESAFDPAKPIPVAPRRGWFFVLDETPRSVKEAEYGSAVEKIMGGLGVTFEDPFTQPTLESGWKVKAGTGASAGALANALRITAPTNHYAGIERQIPKNAVAVEVEVEAGTDAGQDWGPGIAIMSGNSVIAQLNLRLQDMRLGVTNGSEFEIVGDQIERGGKHALRIVLGEKDVYYQYRVGDEAWETVASFVRINSRQEPTALRVGKMAKFGAWKNFSSPGETGDCAIFGVKVFGK